ncbi:MAG: redoxin domain-containing protein [Caulobacteraceae bacterium]|nr:redoxin domain-containing protein [Caulobacteraceae bacterium]
MQPSPQETVAFAVKPPDFGEPARFFSAPTGKAARYTLDAAAGRWMVLMFFGSLTSPPSLEALDLTLRRRELFDDLGAAFYGVSVDPADRDQRGLIDSEPGVRFFWDFDHAVSRLYGLASDQYFRPAVFLIDPAFRVVMAEPIEAAMLVMDRLERELRAAAQAAESPCAPILTLPRIFEPELCAALIDYFRKGAPTPSGFAIEVEGRTVLQANPLFKRRSDVMIEDEALVGQLQRRLETRLFPMIQRAFGWRAKYIERFLICRYGAEDQGFFFPHRDDATAGTAHRKFAVTLNLNAEDYEGGDLRFREYGPRVYRPPTGGATVFSCALLHEATPVTRGERFVFVPFLYDEEGERIRQMNLGLVGN